METLFLIILILIMIGALASGFPVAFSLPGAAVISILLAATFGYIIEGNPNEYFFQDGPIQWLTAGITNFRGIYWEVERDTLIAIPLFIFMGIMLQKSKIAEDLLVTMGQLFGPVPGGLGISVIFVGALLAATTGIVGATVVAMGLISLPAMLKNKYDKSLASGIVCSSGTLGQIIPPSIVLIILADQLASASDVANTKRQTEYKLFTGEFNMPGDFSVASTSAGDMFLGAFLPGLVLVGLYMLYILIYSRIKPNAAPPVPYDGKYDKEFAIKVFLALVPPLALIFIVLGSILLGIATVNQAGAIGAVGATMMGGYRLYQGKSHAYTPSIIAILSIISLYFLMTNFELTIKKIGENPNNYVGVMLAGVAVTFLLISVFWSFWRTYKIKDTLKSVMLETCVTTSMVFIILVGAAMLTAAFRGFGGEELVTDFLTGLPGGFWTQFVVVMVVIFILGFFLDFIEIAVVVVPIIAPILLAQTDANVTAVWLGVMIGVNMQTSFLTPPFGFSLFYLRGVAPASVSTVQIWKGAVAFIILQLIGLGIVGYFPSLVNYLPNRTYLTSEVAPPPLNPRLQECIQEYKFDLYENDEENIKSSISILANIKADYLPVNQNEFLKNISLNSMKTFELVNKYKNETLLLEKYSENYKSLHQKVRKMQKNVFKLDKKIQKLEREINNLKTENKLDKMQKLENKILDFEEDKQNIINKIPLNWEKAHEEYKILAKNKKTSLIKYRRNIDETYENLQLLKQIIIEGKKLPKIENNFIQIKDLISKNISRLDNNMTINNKDELLNYIKMLEKELSSISGTNIIKDKVTKSRRIIKKENNYIDALINFEDAIKKYKEEIQWRNIAINELLPYLDEFDNSIKNTIGLRLQEKLSKEQAIFVATCRSIHKDISLNF